MGAPSKRAKKIRSASEFDLRRLIAALASPPSPPDVHAWSLGDIKDARDAQRIGRFALAARLSEAMRTDDAIAVAYENRLDPLRCLPVTITPGKGARANGVANEADALFGQKGIGIAPGAISDIHGCLVDHGVAFGVNVATPREDGSRIDFFHRAWPIEWVRWDEYARCFKTRVDPSSVQAGDVPTDPSLGAVTSSEIPIIHGDGRWVIYAKHDLRPFTSGALLPAALVWARHAFANRDWAKGSVAAGNAKVLGALPEGFSLQSAEGQLTEEAAALLELLRSIAFDESPVGIKPAGATVEFVESKSSQWQVWKELVADAAKAAARIYLGTDGTLGAQGGAPGVNITELFGVAATKVQGDVECIERAFGTGVMEPWCALNFGDSSVVPTRKILVPDEDQDARHDAYAKRTAAFFADIAAAREAGFLVDQAYADGLAAKHGVVAPTVAPPPAPAAAPAPPAATPLRLVPPATPTPMERAEHAAKMSANLLADIREARALGLVYSQKQIEETAARYGVPAPKLETK